MARLHEIRDFDTTNTYWGPAVSLFFNHCPHKCKGCWNPETHELDTNLEIPNDKVISSVIEYLDKYGIHKDLTLLGGDPLSPFNTDDVFEIISKIKELRPKTRIVCWTGYTWERCKENKNIPMIDILIDGQFIQKLLVSGKKYGSSNQRIIDVKSSLENNSLVILNE